MQRNFNFERKIRVVSTLVIDRSEAISSTASSGSSVASSDSQNLNANAASNLKYIFISIVEI